VMNIDPILCDQQPGCPARRVCPARAIYRVESAGRPGPWAIDPELCTGCGACVRVCPMSAISVSAGER
jgi:Fe-S-cluster-containing hydrogenase component 2